MAKPKTPLLAADCVAFDTRGRLLLVRRKYPPFRGQYALPGGFVEIGETVDDAARRELEEETGVKAGRDPRGHTCSVVLLTHVVRARARAGDNAAAVEWVADWSNLDPAFDHGQILTDAVHMLEMYPPKAG